jgi:Topoisomerase VI B subunit, transducer
VPIGKKEVLERLHKELKAEFCTVVKRPAATYWANPFQVKVGIAFGRSGGYDVEVGDSAAEHNGEEPADVGRLAKIERGENKPV